MEITPHSSPRPLALITGATGGLGRHIAQRLALTHDLIVQGRRQDALDDLKQNIHSHHQDHTKPRQHKSDDCPCHIHLVRTDLLHPDAGHHLLTPPDGKQVENLDVLIHAAGIAQLGTVANTSTEQWRETMAVNFLAVVDLTRAALTALRSARGHVLVVNSGAGLHSKPAWGSYSASKYAVRSFADTLRAEEPTIRVTSVYPGRIDTPMQEEIVAWENASYEPERYLPVDDVALAIVNTVLSPQTTSIDDLSIRPRIVEQVNTEQGTREPDTMEQSTSDPDISRKETLSN